MSPEPTFTDALRYLLSDADRWRSSKQVGAALDPLSSGPKAVASKARREGKIFGGWDGVRFHYPSFQFDAGGLPHPMTSALVRVLPRDRRRLTVGVEACLWVFQPDMALEGLSPAEVFPRDPRQVIELARSRRDGSDALD